MLRSKSPPVFAAAWTARARGTAPRPGIAAAGADGGALVLRGARISALYARFAAADDLRDVAGSLRSHLDFPGRNVGAAAAPAGRRAGLEAERPDAVAGAVQPVGGGGRNVAVAGDIERGTDQVV